MQTLLRIGGQDFSKFVQQKTYKMDENPVTKDYVDANNRKHKKFIRNKIMGSFEIVFMQQSDMDLFLDKIQLAGNGIAIPVTVFVTNNQKLRSVNAFVNVKTTSRVNANDDYFVGRYSVVIEER